MGRTSWTFPSAVPPPRAVLLDQLALRQRAIRSLGLVAPPRLAQGSPDALARRIARLDRWIARELDLAGGMRFPAWRDDGRSVPRSRSR